MPKGFKLLLIALLIPTLALAVYVARSYYLDTREQVGAEPVSQPATETIAEEVVTPTPQPAPQPEEKPLPATAMLEVPFTSQAPLGNWDALHEEACEEASLLMVEYFLNGKSIVSASTTSSELEKIVGWEEERNYGVSITLAQLVEVAKGYYGRSGARIITNPTVTDLQKELAAGRPVIIPAAGRQLGNPNFTPPGPTYHIFVRFLGGVFGFVGGFVNGVADLGSFILYLVPGFTGFVCGLVCALANFVLIVHIAPYILVRLLLLRVSRVNGGNRYG